jgi:phage gp36-like protein
MAYATTTQLYAIGVPEAALTSVDPSHVAIGLDVASAFVDSYLRARYDVPFIVVPFDVTRATCIIAAYDLMVARGYSPETVDNELRNRYLDIIKWLERISAGELSPFDPNTATTSGASYGVSVSTDDLRGW